MKKKTKILITIVSILIVLILGGIAAASNYLYTFALIPVAKKDVFDSDSATISKDETSGSYADQDYNWMKETAGTITMTSYDDLNLSAYQIAAKEDTHKYAVIVHGYKSNALHMASFIKNFYDMGYHILAPDLRGHGLSEGDYIGMGGHDSLDVIDWTKQIIANDPEAEIVLFGVSMGAATVMIASGRELPDQVKAIIEDCGYTSVWDEFSVELKRSFHLPAFPLLYTSSLVSKIRAGYFFSEASPITQVTKAVKPMLFIHGDADDFVPFSMLEPLYEAATCEKEKLIIEGAGHGQAASTNPDLYWTTVEAFLNKHMQ